MKGAAMILACMVLIVICMLVSGCAVKSEPQIVTKEVKVAVATPCKPTLPPRPALKTKDQISAAVSSTQNLDDKIKIITEQLLLYIGWTPVVEAGLNGCEGRE